MKTQQPAASAISCLVVLALLLFANVPSASAGLASEDPMVRITAPAVTLDPNAVLAKVSKDVSKATGIKESFITYFWQSFDTIVYEGQKTDKPVFVDLYVPSFFSDEDVRGLMRAVANALVDHAKADRKWLFIHTHFPLPGQVYIAGDITSWDSYRGQPNNDPRPMEERAFDKFLFNDTAFVFQCLWRFGLTATGGSDMGELLTITSKIKDFDKESWYQSWNGMADTVLAKAEAFAAAKHGLSARQAYFRASNYYRAAAVYFYNNDPRGYVAWEKGRDTFLKAAALSQGRIQAVRIPYEKTTLPGYLVKPDNSGKKRPTALVQTGLDGTAEDLYFIIGREVAKRGYNCLIYEGPGQGEMIYEQKIPFRHDWEKVVTPVVDYALSLPEVDAKRLALVGYSMGGYLAPRALAHEKRIPYGVVDSGVFSVFDGTMTKFDDSVKQAVEAGQCSDKINQQVLQKMDKHADLNQFINQMFWTFDSATPCELFGKLHKYTLKGQIGNITAEMLVLNSSQDQVAASKEQCKIFYNALKSKKNYHEFNESQGCQFHCQLGAPMVSSEVILNWLDERLRP